MYVCEIFFAFFKISCCIRMLQNKVQRAWESIRFREHERAPQTLQLPGPGPLTWAGLFIAKWVSGYPKVLLLILDTIIPIFLCIVQWDKKKLDPQFPQNYVCIFGHPILKSWLNLALNMRDLALMMCIVRIHVLIFCALSPIWKSWIHLWSVYSVPQQNCMKKKKQSSGSYCASISQRVMEAIYFWLSITLSDLLSVRHYTLSTP